MDDKYNLACTEILEVLKYLPEKDLKKIPQKEIDFFEEHKAKNYTFKFNENLSFEEQVLLPETQTIIVQLYKISCIVNFFSYICRKAMRI